jgi:holo-[acyl-carrier protein] synthase
MIDGLGIDNVDIPRMEKIISKDNLFRDRVFTLAEIEYCTKQASPAKSFAARFAAKEAFVKALGIGFIGNLEFAQVEVRLDTLGKPSINLLGEAALIAKEKQLTNIHISLTHSDTIASAVVILEK